MAQLAVLIPLMRPHKIAPLIDNIAETTSDYRVIVMAAGECADACRDLPITLVEDGGGTWPQRINAGYRASAEQMIFTAADDLWFRPGWFEAAMIVMNQFPNGSGVVAVNDLHNRAGVHFLLAKSYIEELGGVMNQPGVVADEDFRHAYVDDCLRATATFHGRFAYANDSIVEHMHVGAGKSQMDEVYALGESTMSEGYATFMSKGHLWQRSEVSA